MCVCVCVALPQLFRCFIRPKSYEKPRGGQTHIYLKIELFSLEHPYVTHFINVSIFKRVNSPRKQISRLQTFASLEYSQIDSKLSIAFVKINNYCRFTGCETKHRKMYRNLDSRDMACTRIFGKACFR